MCYYMSIDKLLNSNMELKLKYQKLEEKFSQTQEELDNSKLEIEDLKKKLSEKVSLSKEEIEEIEAIKSGFNDLKNELKNANSKISELNEILKNKDSELIQANEKISSLSNQVNSVEEFNNIINTMETKIQEANEIISEKDQIIEEQLEEIELIKAKLNNLKPRKAAIKPRTIYRGRARACIKCSEYAILSLNDPENQKFIKKFEQNHKGHTIITVDLSEIKDSYRNIELIEDNEIDE